MKTNMDNDQNKKLLLCHLGCLWTATWPKKRSSNYNWDLKIPKIIKESMRRMGRTGHTNITN